VYRSGQLQFFGESAALADATAFADWLTLLREGEWVVYAKRPFAGPAAVLAYLSRYTHTGSRSPTDDSSPWMSAASPSAGRITGPREGHATRL
jgi:hypothetical protein